MIEKNEVLNICKNLSLRPETVEKDYVLGWMLDGISKHPVTSTWAFKGGTSLKKMLSSYQTQTKKSSCFPPISYSGHS